MNDLLTYDMPLNRRDYDVLPFARGGCGVAGGNGLSPLFTQSIIVNNGNQLVTMSYPPLPVGTVGGFAITAVGSTTGLTLRGGSGSTGLSPIMVMGDTSVSNAFGFYWAGGLNPTTAIQFIAGGSAGNTGVAGSRAVIRPRNMNTSVAASAGPSADICNYLYMLRTVVPPPVAEQIITSRRQSTFSDHYGLEPGMQDYHHPDGGLYT